MIRPHAHAPLRVPLRCWMRLTMRLMLLLAAVPAAATLPNVLGPSASALWRRLAEAGDAAAQALFDGFVSGSVFLG